MNYIKKKLQMFKVVFVLESILMFVIRSITPLTLNNVRRYFSLAHSFKIHIIKNKTICYLDLC